MGGNLASLIPRLHLSFSMLEAGGNHNIGSVLPRQTKGMVGRRGLGGAYDNIKKINCSTLYAHIKASIEG